MYELRANRSQLEKDDCFFLTKNGYFRRAPVGEVKKDHVIAIIGGA